MSDLLNIGRTGLNASKKSLETTGHNIANANTEGYSRQRVHQVTNTPIGKGGLIHGTGTLVKSVKRVHDQFVAKRLQRSITNNEYFTERSKQLSEVEQIFNEVDSEGLNKIMNRFFNSFRELANQPENETIRSVVRDNAKLIIKDFKRIRETLNRVSRHIDQRMESNVADINISLEHVARLNKKIQALEANYEETGDLRDQRDNHVRNLAKYMQIHTYTNGKGQYVVEAHGVGTLVTGAQPQKMMTASLSEADSSNKMAGAVEIFFENRPSQAISKAFRGGAMGSLLKARNEDVLRLQEGIDQIAYEFMNSVNAIHRRGYVSRQIDVGPDGKPVDFDAKGPTTNIDFFKVPADVHKAAEKISLSDAVEGDLSNLATALAPNSPGDNRVAIAISKLQHEKIIGGGVTTLEEHFLQTIGRVGLEAGKAHLDAEQSEGLLAQAKNIRERLSGVSIDEETANMVKYQHAYDASAKVMQTADEMFDTIIGIKR